VANAAPNGRRFIGLALMAGAVPLTGFAWAIFTGVVAVGDDLRGTLAGVLGLVAAVDLLAGFWLLRSSLSA